ncbi:helix-turn-helix domain-containing protein [Curtobacterium sp. MCLR17_044]|uniref:helix-turn-helix domain-containing protein n=1 Tax=Curtobacterium sp. MCLR17_044 TaxID=2175628 RepID=UPI0021ACE732|nr:helix-turn-helix domain-containing protein [Curtobacterium sp. MCLR17_044]
MDEPWSTSLLASTLRVSGSTLFARFKEASGMTPVQYLKRTLLGEARRRMVVHGDTAAWAAAAVGFRIAGWCRTSSPRGDAPRRMLSPSAPANRMDASYRSRSVRRARGRRRPRGPGAARRVRIGADPGAGVRREPDRHRGACRPAGLVASVTTVCARDGCGRND